MSTKTYSLAALTLLLAMSMAQGAPSGNVKVLPLGSHDGEFCRYDRALVFEDPDGTRMLYDPGRTVRGPTDPRLGKIDVVLLSHVHSDHLGDRHASVANAGTCAEPEFSVDATPVSNSVNIVVAKQASFIVGGEMAGFFASKVKAAGGAPDLVKLLRFGAERQVGGLTIASVPAVHSNGLSPVFLDKAHAEVLQANGLTAYVGPPGGFVVRFSNGLAVYLSGDTGITAEQELVVRRHYKVNLAVINIGGTFTTGPAEAAYVMNDLVRPRSVIASHANEMATVDGNLVAGSRTDTFKKAVDAPVYLPLSGATMAFDGEGRCVAGC